MKKILVMLSYYIPSSLSPQFLLQEGVYLDSDKVV